MRAAPLFREIPWLEPVEAFAPFAREPFALLLESALAGGPQGRYSFIAAGPSATMAIAEEGGEAGGAEGPVPCSRQGTGSGAAAIEGDLTGRTASARTATGGPAHAARLQETDRGGSRRRARDPFESLRAELGRHPLERIPGLPPFQGGAAGLFGYELNRFVEKLPPPVPDLAGFPDLALGFYDTVVSFDHAQRRAWIVSSGHPETDARLRILRARERMEETARRLGAAVPGARAAGPARPLPGAPASRPSGPRPDAPAAMRGTGEGGAGATAFASNFTAEGYVAAVRRVIEYIRAGDIFQANLSQRFRAVMEVDDSAFALYLRLRSRSAAPFAAFFNLGGRQVVSSSPERFLRVEQGRVESRPIKGTRPRSDDPAADRALAEELLASEKDLAENLMIVDLLRNDLSRVCRPGSVSVPSLRALESYATVHHLVSTVTGTLEDGATAIDLLRAAFPGGSITGAPKIRAMEIIRELEPDRRGPYCGSLGYAGFDGSMDTSIAIRTIAVLGREASFHAGGGVVADSSPEAEYEETLVKARALREVL